MNNSRRLPTILAACGVALLSAVLLVATAPSLPIVWDEGDTIERAERIESFFWPADSAATWKARLDRVRVRDEAWPFTTQLEGHPPLSYLLVALGSHWAPRDVLSELSSARLGSMLLFAVAIGAMFYRLQREYRVPAVSLLAVAAMLTMPRLFAHAHFATGDAPLTACWVLTWATFAPASRDWRAIPLFGLMLGLTLATRFSGWLAVLPFLAWVIVYRDYGGWQALVVGVPLAVAVFVALNPPLWNHPLTGLRTFFELNLHRAARPEHNITTQFFGRMYNLDFPLPWYNSLVWTAITISPMSLLFGILGLVWTARCWREDRAAVLIACQWLTLVVARALPWAPPHDAERLILPSFAFFAALVGIGMGRSLYRFTLLTPEKIIAQGWAKVAMVFVLGAGTFDAIAYFPHGLSYYNRLIGGLRGATSLGMEPTYYWDSLDRTALAWLSEHTAADERICFGAAPSKNLELLARWGELDRQTSKTGPCRWYVIQRRPSAWQPADRWLIEHGQPAYESTFSGVPLLDVYPYKQYEEAVAAVRKADWEQ